MQNDAASEKLEKYKAMIISTNIPNDILFDMLESFMTTDEQTPFAESVPVLDGQMSLFESV